MKNKHSLRLRRKLLVICGPTATGKTELALQLAKVFNGIPISADSRQVYKYMDIGTGKGPEKILGYDLVDPNDEFSVSNYSRFARKAIEDSYQENKLPILVGGTGLYIRGVIENIGTLDVPRNKKLREELSQKSREELVEILIKINPEKAKAMNESDRRNPRRLVRAIEVGKSSELNTKTSKDTNYDVLMIGLTASREELERRIEDRVVDRVRAGFESEINFLQEKGYWDGAPSKTLGYKDWPDVNKWKLEEVKYAKRQMTWFKKDKRIKWFDVSDVDYQKDVEKLVKRWYS